MRCEPIEHALLRDLLLETKDGEWGSAERSAESTEMLVVRGTDFDDVRRLDLRRVPSRHILHRHAARKTLTAGDVLIETAGGSTGRPTGRTVFLRDELFRQSEKPITCASFARFLRFDNSKIDSEYVYWWLQSLYQSRAIETHQVQHSGIARFQFTKFANEMRVPVPHRDVQRFIVETLGSLERRIAVLSQTNATLESIAQTLFKSWFIDFDPVRAKAEGREPEGMDAETAALFADGLEDSALGEIPKGWDVQRLGDVVQKITKGTTPTTLKRPFVASGINFLKVESISDDGELLPEKFAYIDDETHSLLQRSQLGTGDVLITIAGTIGRTAIVTEDFLPANTNQAVALIRPSQNSISSGFINRFLRRKDSKQAMGERVVQAVQANLSLGTLSDLKLVVPPHHLAERLYGAAIRPIEDVKTLNSQRVRTLSALRDTLLPRLISGKLCLPEAEANLNEALA